MLLFNLSPGALVTFGILNKCNQKNGDEFWEYLIIRLDSNKILF